MSVLSRPKAKGPTREGQPFHSVGSETARGEWRAVYLPNLETQQVPRVKCYVDGFNLYHAVKELGRPELKWLNLRSVAELMLRRNEKLAGVHYFTAIAHWDAEKAQRHREYINALRACGVK